MDDVLILTNISLTCTSVVLKLGHSLDGNFDKYFLVSSYCLVDERFSSATKLLIIVSLIDANSFQSSSPKFKKQPTFFQITDPPL